MPPKTTRIKTEAVAVSVPATDQEAAEYIAALSAHQRELRLLGAAADEQKAAVERDYLAAAQPHQDEINKKFKGLGIYCEANRERLTQGGKIKSVDFGHGLVAWRLRPTSVRVSSVAMVIELLKKLNLTRFVRVKEEVDKEAILKEPDAVKNVSGLTFSQVEDFVVKPYETDVEVVLERKVEPEAPHAA